MKHTLIWTIVVLAIVVVMCCLLMAFVDYCRKREGYWPDSVWSDGYYWQSQQTFNNRNRYFDMMPYLGLYRHIDLGTYRDPKKKEVEPSPSPDPK